MCAKSAKRMRDTRRARKDAGQCPQCGVDQTGKTNAYCAPCIRNANATKISRKEKYLVIDSIKSDRKAGRITEIPVDYITEEFLIDIRKQQNDRCVYCTISVCNDCGNRNIPGKMNNLVSVERKDNNLPHIKSNCVIACWRCNNKRIGDARTPSTQKKHRIWLAKRIRKVKALRAIQTIENAKEEFKKEYQEQIAAFDSLIRNIRKLLNE
jgi:hypothetical protein